MEPLDALRLHLSTAELALQNLDELEKAARECAGQVTNEQWQRQLAELNSHRAAVEAATHSAQRLQIGSVQRRLKRRRARKMRRANRSWHKQLSRRAQDCRNNQVQVTYENLQTEARAVQERVEIDRHNEQDANWMLSEISRKKNDLSAFHQKVISLQNYRLTQAQGDSTSASDLFKDLKEKITKRLMLYNKEESRIRQLFKSYCSPLRPPPAGQVQHFLSNSGKSKKAATFAKIWSAECRQAPVSSWPVNQWSKYVDVSSPSCDRPNASTSVTTSVVSAWRKYSLPEACDLMNHYDCAQ